MKKRLSILLALLVATALLLVLPALASDGAPYIRDEALLLTYDEETALEKQAQSIADSTSCAVYVLTVDSIGSQTIRDFAKAYYTDNAPGLRRRAQRHSLLHLHGGPGLCHRHLREGPGR